ncbi:hypothetical protein KAU33_15565 [Candidatus Dependentiae bacterium]|nr:hypothetical protein [Candidatus Dependentiae bacterium]
MEYIVVMNDMTVKKVKYITEEEIPNALDSEVIIAFFRFNENNELEYADVDFENDVVTWKKPDYLIQS